MVAAARTLGSPVLVGHSMGGLLAQVVATQTDVSGVALLASAPPFGIPTIPRLSVLVAGFRHALGWTGSGPMVPDSDNALLSWLDPDQRVRPTMRRTAEPRRLARQLTFWPPRVDSARVRGPEWVGGGDDDPVIRPWVTRRLAAKHGVEPTIYRGAGHMLNLEPGWSTVARRPAEVGRPRRGMRHPDNQIDDATAGWCLLLSLGYLTFVALVVVLLVVGVILAVFGG